MATDAATKFTAQDDAAAAELDGAAGQESYEGQGNQDGSGKGGWHGGILPAG